MIVRAALVTPTRLVDNIIAIRVTDGRPDYPVPDGWSLVVLDDDSPVGRGWTFSPTDGFAAPPPPSPVVDRIAEVRDSLAPAIAAPIATTGTALQQVGQVRDTLNDRLDKIELALGLLADEIDPNVT